MKRISLFQDLNKERLDYVLILLSVEQYFWCGISAISNAFEKAGFGSPNPYLQHLVDEGYIERRVAGNEDFKLNEKGAIIYEQGGFVGRATVAHETRAATLLTLVAIIALLSFAIMPFLVNMLQ